MTFRYFAKQNEKLMEVNSFNEEGRWKVETFFDFLEGIISSIFASEVEEEEEEEDVDVERRLSPLNFTTLLLSKRTPPERERKISSALILCAVACFSPFFPGYFILPIKLGYFYW